MSNLDDDGFLSGEFLAIEDPDSTGHKQALWVRVGPAYREDGNTLGVWISYQKEHMKSSLEGPVLLDIQTWRELNEAVEKRLFWRQPGWVRWARFLSGATRWRPWRNR